MDHIACFYFGTWTYPLELWYLVPPILAGLPLILLMFGNLLLGYPKSEFQWTMGHSLLVVGAFSVGVLGIGMDRFWCWLFGTKLWDMFTASSFTFFGCDLAFLGIQKWLSWTRATKSVEHFDAHYRLQTKSD